MTSAAATVTTRRLPGVDGIWALIGADAVFFAVLFGSFMQERRLNPGLFEASRQTLDSNLGGINTLVLLISSWTVAMAIQALKHGQAGLVPRLLLAGVLTGGLFMVSKTIEYAAKISNGITPVSNSFFMWYYALTGIHLLHVILGTALLAFVWLRSRRAVYSSTNRVVPECVASFWHLVDLLWVWLFPLLYLIKAA